MKNHLKHGWIKSLNKACYSLIFLDSNIFFILKLRIIIEFKIIRSGIILPKSGNSIETLIKKSFGTSAIPLLTLKSSYPRSSLMLLY
ncbi:hypothetical protein CQA44_09550 [Helicobacter sp. MIT 14-3879]|nr:hypothetical protein CQA44_09550 [Helicobacter sp. MIT 14-3879]